MRAQEVSSVAHRWKSLSPAGHIPRPCEGSTERETNSLEPYAIPILTSRIAFNWNFGLLMKGSPAYRGFLPKSGIFPAAERAPAPSGRGIINGRLNMAQGGQPQSLENSFAHSAALCSNDRAPGRVPREISRPFLMSLLDACVPVDRLGNILSSWRRPSMTSGSRSCGFSP